MAERSQAHDFRIGDGNRVSSADVARLAKDEAASNFAAEAMDSQSKPANMGKPLPKGFSRDEAQSIANDDQSAQHALMYGLSSNGGTEYWYHRNAGKWDKDHNGAVTKTELDQATIDGTNNLYDAALLVTLRKNVLAIQNLSNDTSGFENGITVQDMARLQAVRESRVTLDELSQLDRQAAESFNTDLASAEERLGRTALRQVMADESVSSLRRSLSFLTADSNEALRILLSKTSEELRAMDHSLRRTYATSLGDYVRKEMSVWPDKYEQVKAKFRQSGMWIR